jgi:hypothetical protein
MAGESFTNFKVFLELQRRNDGFNTGQQNRIPLFVNSINIQTNKSVMNVPIPFSGAIRGEATNLALDIGMAQKTISLEGVLLGQTIIKNKGGAEDPSTVAMTSFELAQLLHSYVDSSALQDDQSLNKLVILIPSRVNKNFDYHDNTHDPNHASAVDISELITIPFSWKNRGYDNSFTKFQGTDGNASYFESTTASDENAMGVTGFIRSFGTALTGTEFPVVTFNMEFEEALVLADNFLDG